MKHVFSLFLVLVSFLAISQTAWTATPSGVLSFKEGKLSIFASFIKSPTMDEDSVLALEAIDLSSRQPAVFTDKIDVELWMPSMGHGSSPTQVVPMMDSDARPLAGMYLVTNVFFIMPGDWEVRVTLTDSQGRVETRSFPVRIAGEGHDHHRPSSLLF